MTIHDEILFPIILNKIPLLDLNYWRESWKYILKDNLSLQLPKNKLPKQNIAYSERRGINLGSYYPPIIETIVNKK